MMNQNDIDLEKKKAVYDAIMQKNGGVPPAPQIQVNPVPPAPQQEVESVQPISQILPQSQIRPSVSEPEPEMPRYGLANALVTGLGGIADAFNAFGGQKSNNAGNTIKQFQNQQTLKRQAINDYLARKKSNLDIAKEQFGIDQAKDANDPNSDTSKQYQALAAKFTNKDPKEYANISASKLKEILKPMESYAATEINADMRKAINANTLELQKMSLQNKADEHKLNLSTREDQQQDKLEEQAKNRISGIRGDASLKNVEAQRDAAITAYNRIDQVEKAGKVLNPIDYVDILGQIYKARTGSAPTETVLNEARQQTAKGSYGKVYTYLTGEQAPATTQAIMKSLKEMAAHMGEQSDKLHEAYMTPHLDMPTSLAPDRAERLKKLARGLSFKDATGYSNNPTVQISPEDQQAIQWAKQNPNDPRAKQIMSLHGM